MLNIVIKRLKGRRGRWDLLSLVLFLSFLFMTTALLMFHDQGLSAQKGREKAYGTWENALYYSDERISNMLISLPEVEQWGKTRIIGSDKRFGVVASTSQEFQDLGNLQLKEGRMPQALDEIAVEEKQLIHFPKDFRLGDELILSVEVKEGEEDKDTVEQLIFYKVYPELVARLEKNPEVIKEISASLKEYLGNWQNLLFYYQPDEQSPEEPLEDPRFIAMIYLYELGHRNDNVLEGHNGTQMVGKREYFYTNEKLVEFLPEKWRKDYAEFPISQSVSMQRDVKVVGILHNYSEAWKGDDEYKPNAFVSEDTAEQLLEKGLFQFEKMDMSSHREPINVFLKSSLGAEEFLKKYGPYRGFLANDFAFPPEEQGKENLLRSGTLALLALVTSFSVFYVYQSKFNKQVRSLGLLRALGGSSKQLRTLLLLEMLLRSLLAFLLATPLSFLISYFMVMRGEHGGFEVPWLLVLLGVSLCFLSIFLATLLPLRKLKDVSLTGSIELKDEGKQKTRELLGGAKALQNFEDVQRRHVLYGKKKRRLRIVELSALLLILLLCLMMIFLSFEEYRREILATGRPDYSFSIPQRGNSGLIHRTGKEFLASPVVKSMETLVRAERIFLDFQGNQGDPLYHEFLYYLPQRFRKEYMPSSSSGFPMAFRTDVFSIEEDGEIYRRLKSSLPNEFDEEAFFEGRGGILLTPRFKQGNPRRKEEDKELFGDILAGSRLRRILEYYQAYDFEVNQLYENLYEQTSTFHGVEEVSLVEMQEALIGAEEYLAAPLYHEKKMKILAHLHSLPKEGIWPFSQDKDYPVVIFSRKGMENFFAYSSFPRWESKSLLEGVRMVGSKGQGHSYFYFKTVDRTPETEMILRKMANTYHMQVEDLGRLADKLYQKGVAGAFLSGLLGFVVLLITSQILYQGFRSELEEERFRIGTLQSLGLHRKEMKKDYLKRAIQDVLWALVLSHLIYTILLILLSFRGQGLRILHLGSLLKLMLWNYPLEIHVLLVLLFAVVGIGTSYFPLRAVLKRTPLENITYKG